MMLVSAVLVLVAGKNTHSEQATDGLDVSLVSRISTK